VSIVYPTQTEHMLSQADIEATAERESKVQRTIKRLSAELRVLQNALDNMTQEVAYWEKEAAEERKLRMQYQEALGGTRAGFRAARPAEREERDA
jgi:ElaB/YqjD/DUF883 family membrane-anchored ribosome-binding protein